MKIGPAFSWNVSIILVVVIGLALSIGGSLVSGHLVEKVHRGGFERDARERLAAVKSGLGRILEALEDTVGLFNASQHVDRREFSHFVGPILQRHMGLQAISWNPLVPGTERAAFEGMARAEVPGFMITQRGADGRMVPAQSRDEHLSVLYIEPLAGNEPALGFDLLSEEVRREAVGDARNSGTVTISRRIRLVQERGSQFGLLILYPVFRNDGEREAGSGGRRKLEGFVVGVVRVGDLVEASIATLAPRGVTFRIRDLSAPGDERLLYTHVSRKVDSEGSVDSGDPFQTAEAPAWSQAFTIADRQWEYLAIHHHPTGDQGHFYSSVPWLIPLVAMTLTVILTAFLMHMRRDSENRHRWEASIRANEAFVQNIVRNSPFGVVVADERGVIQLFNRAAEQIFGHGEQEMLGKRVEDLIPHAVRDAHEAGFRRYLETGEARILGKPPFDAEGLRADGTICPVRLAVNRLDHNDGRPSFVAMITDLTEEKRLQVELIQSEKMAGLGGMVAGVAHEINTPVGIGVTAASELEERNRSFARLLSGEGISQEELEAHIASTDRLSGLIRANLERAAELIRSFKSVAVDQSSEEDRCFKVLDCVNSAVLSLGHEIKNTRLTVSVDGPGDLEILGNPGAVSQIVFNLVNNSRMHGFEADEPGNIDIEFTEDGNRVFFRYRDNGRGMEEEELRRIFEPFFTTGRDRGGSGLGMHIVYNLATQVLGGTISCRSAPGEGVAFQIVWPFDGYCNNSETNEKDDAV